MARNSVTWPGLADVFEGPGTGFVVQGYISEDWARSRWNFQHCLRSSYCAISVLDQLFYLRGMYSVSRQTLLG